MIVAWILCHGVRDLSVVESSAAQDKPQYCPQAAISDVLFYLLLCFTCASLASVGHKAEMCARRGVSGRGV
jgi:hypothetical protein